jgi:hypothetical protein
VFKEKVGGAKTDRAELAKLLRRIEPGDMLIVTRLDRLVRSTRDLLNVIAALADRVCHARGRSPEGQEAEGRPCRMIFRSRMQRLPLRYAVKTWPGSPAIFFTRLYLNHDVSSDCACPCCQEQRSDTGYEKAGTHHFVHHHSGSGHPVLAGVRGLCAGADQ